MLRIPITPSPALVAALVLMHGLAAACVLGFAPGWIWILLALVALAASLFFHLRRDALLRARDSVTEIGLREDASCDLLTRGGAVLQGRVLPSTFASGLLVTINVRLVSGRGRSVILLPDSATGENRRALRVWLRHALRLEQSGSTGL
jgi:toxin CptA